MEFYFQMHVSKILVSVVHSNDKKSFISCTYLKHVWINSKWGFMYVRYLIFNEKCSPMISTYFRVLFSGRLASLTIRNQIHSEMLTEAWAITWALFNAYWFTTYYTEVARLGKHLIVSKTIKSMTSFPLHST